MSTLHKLKLNTSHGSLEWSVQMVSGHYTHEIIDDKMRNVLMISAVKHGFIPVIYAENKQRHAALL